MILNSTKLKQSADDNFNVDENSIKFSKRVENTVGKGEIARYEQFLLFPLCFQKVCFPRASKVVIVWNGLKDVTNQNPTICRNYNTVCLEYLGSYSPTIIKNVPGLVLQIFLFLETTESNTKFV